MQNENLGNGRINLFPGQACEWVDYSQGSGDSDDPNHSDVRGFTQDPSLATAVTSVTRDQSIPGTTPFAETMHKVVIDLDHDARLVPSSTPGHHHLFIDKPMRWDQLVRLLCVLAEVGLVEPGYVSASIERGHTSVRLPDVKRDVPRPVESKPMCTGGCSVPAGGFHHAPWCPLAPAQTPQVVNNQAGPVAPGSVVFQAGHIGGMFHGA